MLTSSLLFIQNGEAVQTKCKRGNHQIHKILCPLYVKLELISGNSSDTDTFHETTNILRLLNDDAMDQWWIQQVATKEVD